MPDVDDLPPLARRQPHLALILVGDVIAAAHRVVDEGAGVGAGAVGADALAVVVLARAGDADAAEQAKALAATFWKECEIVVGWSNSNGEFLLLNTRCMTYGMC